MKRFRKKMIGQEPDNRPRGDVKRATYFASDRRQAVLVLGMHRSGTSALTRVFNLLGATLPSNLLGAGEGNAAGHWESPDLMTIHDEILSSAGSRWDDWRAFNPDWNASQVAIPYKQKLADALERNWSASPLFVVKDPRICRFVPIWLDVLDRIGAQPHVVIPIRNPLEVAASLKARNGFLPATSYLLWLRHVLDAERDTRALPRAFTTYDGLLKDWRGVVGEVARKADLRWPRHSDFVELEIDKFLATTLRHHSIDAESLGARAEIVDWVRDVHDILQKMARGDEDRRHLARLDQVRTEFDKAAQAFGLVLAENEEVVSVAKKRAADGEKSLTEREQEVAKLKVEAQAQSKALETLNGQVEQSRREAGALREEVNSVRTWLREAQTQVQSLAGEGEHWRAQLAERERQAAEQKRLAAERLTALKEEQKRAALLVLEIEAARDEIKQLAAVKDRLSAAEASFASEKKTSQRQNDELVRLQSMLMEAESSVAARDAKFAAEAKRIAGEMQILRAQAEKLRATVARQAAAPEGKIQKRRSSFSLLGSLRKRFSRRRQPEIEAHAWEIEIIRRSKLFRPVLYLEHNPDVAAHGDDPLEHYLAHGGGEKRNPHPLFDAHWYVTQYPQAADAKMTPLTHYITIGVSEGLDPMPLFNTDFYLRQNPEVTASGVNPLYHYMAQGAYEGRDPHPLFDSSWYLAQNPDVAAAKENPLLHYITRGWKEGRDPHPDFDAKWYLGRYEDVAAAGQNPLEHYVLHGQKEGRERSRVRSNANAELRR